MTRKFEPLFVDIDADDRGDGDTMAIWAGDKLSSAQVAGGILDHDYAHEIVRRWNAFEELQALVAEVNGALCDAVADLEGWASSGPEGMTADERDRANIYQETIDETAKKLAAYLLPAKVKVGDNVKLTRDYGDYPLEPIPAGSAGVVVAIDSEHIHVRMADTFPMLDAWDNVLQVSTQHDGTWTPDHSALAAYLPHESIGRGQNIDTKA